MKTRAVIFIFIALINSYTFGQNTQCPVTSQQKIPAIAPQQNPKPNIDNKPNAIGDKTVIADNKSITQSPSSNQTASLNGINIKAILENIIAGMAVTGLIGALAYLISCEKNRRLEKSLVEAINPNGVGIRFNLTPPESKFSLQIHNYADATIRVRTVVIMCDKYHLELLPDSKIHQTPLSNEAVRPIFRRIFLSRELLSQDNNPNSVLLPPKTMSTWHADEYQISSREWIVNNVYVVIEYATMFGRVAMIRIAAKGPAFKLIKDELEGLARAAYRKEPLQNFLPLK